MRLYDNVRRRTRPVLALSTQTPHRAFALSAAASHTACVPMGLRCALASLLLSAIVQVVASTTKTVAVEVQQPGWLAELSHKQYRVDGQVWHAVRCEGLQERLQCPSPCKVPLPRLPPCPRGLLYYGETSRTFLTAVPLHAPPASTLWGAGETRLGVPFLTHALVLPSSCWDWLTIVAPPAAFCLAKAVAGRLTTKPRMD